MDDIFSIIFLMWVLFTIVEGVALNKKRKMPQIDEIEPIGDIKQITQIELPAIKSEPINPIEVPKIKREPTENVSNAFTPDDVMNAFIYAEIFSKPKSLRK